ncbi:MAG TPA: hypothetical protein VNZ84_03710 [Methylophilus sp.]|nr:hypothetical protein [Methylophilus sp.]
MSDKNNDINIAIYDILSPNFECQFLVDVLRQPDARSMLIWKPGQQTA